MEKILIEVEGTIHTFESIKEAAKYKVEFLEQMESLLDESSDQRIYECNLIKNKFINNPNKFCDRHIKGCSITEIEELLIDLCVAGVDIDEYLVYMKQDEKKRGFCGIANYKNFCEKFKEDADDFSKKMISTKICWMNFYLAIVYISVLPLKRAVTKRTSPSEERKTRIRKRTENNEKENIICQG